MIIGRYLSRQLFASTLAVTLVLSLILVTGRFIKYLADAAAGRLLGEVLLTIMVYRIPGFLELILPLGLFLGILLAYGQLYMNYEMTVLSACGISQAQLIRFTLIPTLCLALVVGLMSVYISPLGNRKVETIFAEQDLRSEFETLSPGKFHTGGQGANVIYAERLSDDKKWMKNLFIYQGEKVTKQGGWERENQILVVAESGLRRVDENSGIQYLDLLNGYRFEGVPGQADYRVVGYKQYTYKLADPIANVEVSKLKALSTRELLNSSDLSKQAELQWRISLPVLALVVSLLAIPLSKVSPRQGRFSRLLPSIILYLAYVSLLITSQEWVEAGTLSPAMGLWWVHGVFFLIAMVLLAWERIKIAWLAQRSSGGDDS